MSKKKVSRKAVKKGVRASVAGARYAVNSTSSDKVKKTAASGTTAGYVAKKASLKKIAIPKTKSAVSASAVKKTTATAATVAKTSPGSPRKSVFLSVLNIVDKMSGVLRGFMIGGAVIVIIFFILGLIYMALALSGQIEPDPQKFLDSLKP